MLHRTQEQWGRPASEGDVSRCWECATLEFSFLWAGAGRERHMASSHYFFVSASHIQQAGFVCFGMHTAAPVLWFGNARCHQRVIRVLKSYARGQKKSLAKILWGRQLWAGIMNVVSRLLGRGWGDKLFGKEIWAMQATHTCYRRADPGFAGSL